MCRQGRVNSGLGIIEEGVSFYPISPERVQTCPSGPTIYRYYVRSHLSPKDLAMVKVSSYTTKRIFRLSLLGALVFGSD